MGFDWTLRCGDWEYDEGRGFSPLKNLMIEHYQNLGKTEDDIYGVPVEIPFDVLKKAVVTLEEEDWYRGRDYEALLMAVGFSCLGRTVYFEGGW
jgi:hypothetical protein